MLLIRQHGSEGRVTDQVVADGDITVGRAPENRVVLPYQVVAKQHARITAVNQTTLKVECSSPLGIEMEGRSGLQNCEVRLGQQFLIGPARFAFSKAESGDGLILHVHAPQAGSTSTSAKTRTRLADAGLSIRRPAWLLAGLILLIGLLLPLALHYAYPSGKLLSYLPSERLWLSGHISNAHASFAAKCSTCHESLFAHVRSEACAACHKNMAQHSDNPAIVAAEGIEGQRCTSCHREHTGAHALIPSNPGVCTDCHARPHRFAEFPNLQPINDFEQSHPAFRSRIIPPGTRTSANLNADLPTLIFAHDLHLKPQGIMGPDGVEALKCSSCHVEDAAKVSFKPIAFEQQCQRCHQLQALIGGQAQQLPHGDNGLVRSFLESRIHGGGLAAAPREISESRRRPGEADQRGGPVSGADLVNEIFDRQVCVQCHQILHEPGKPVAVRPPPAQSAMFPDAKFTHAKHRSVNCNDCHAATTSSSLQTMTSPKIETCRQCHTNVDAARGVPTACTACHGFHRAGKLSFGESLLVPDPHVSMPPK